MRKHGLFLFGAKNTASFMEVRGLTWAYYQMSKLNNWVDTKDEESNLEEDEI